MIPVYEPYLPKQCLKYPKEALESTWVSSVGKYKEKATEALKIRLNVNYLLLVNNGTSAVHLMALALKKKYPYIKNIIVPDNVYVAAWNGFLYNKDYNLKVFPLNDKTWNINIKETRSSFTRDTALLAVHNIGNIINVPELLKKYPDLIVLEDNCEGLFGRYNGSYSGTVSFCSACSFFGNKAITCGEGGAFLTNDKEIFDYVKKAHGQGQSEERYIFDILGYNYRMTNVQAALLYGQLKILDEIIDKKKKVMLYYKKFLKNFDVEFQKEEIGTEHSNWMVGIKIKGEHSSVRLREELIKNGIDSRPMFYPMYYHSHLKKYYRKKGNNFPFEKCLILPSSPNLSKKQINFICENIKKFLSQKV